uniref:Dihydroxyacetone kinase n=1 Tax=Odontella aurita TaxID=265563 RepID=A0A7S4JGT7_9STRA|mmetsp:Transcript_46311/g.140290  ORF Transcript_46311/g.140290 Transcript_46311/m.140290 type:complete len:603 (+) Transcript_46311:178-1986(+)|eukprot:CAMPEP_0113560296 /NCGR_PEP_ID=MMETSP0015_2-20120614/19355_1 /TAXON_ID=2838 /ORGANISM="Odontella" /LENGTH=602 /DNA_ID=CAMNT_0000461991 /DNA_START=174 /DNA_END=1982 /DNA_ORIENTATION=+ /assembly_acc=CAM_ASM_000160
MAAQEDAATAKAVPKKFLNKPEDGVKEMISGLLMQYPNKLRKLQNHNVLLSSTISYDKVNILSGGGSGHEPSHAGWIGTGMLTGAILGGIFASPAVASILAAIRAVTQIGSGAGCLLVVKNYTGDRLNFGMACELANAEGRKCRMVVVADDCAVERTKGITGARGVAGTVLVHKAAGAAADRGMDLDSVAETAEAIAKRIGSLGVALNAVTIPGAASVNDRLDASTIEIGLGIHGEAGIRQSPLMSSDDLAKVIVTTIRDYGLISSSSAEDKIVPTFAEGDELAVMMNNLGGTSNFEMSILTNSVVSLLEGPMGCRVSRVYVGSYMTSFDMQGASVSIVNITGEGAIKGLLDHPSDAISWSSVDLWKSEDEERPSAVEFPEVPGPEEGAGPSHDGVKNNIENFAAVAVSMLRAACSMLSESEPLLTKYDTIVGDGDCGLTMERGAKEVLLRLDAGELDISHPIPLFSSLANAVSASMGGTSGVLLELMFRKMGTYLLSQDTVDAKSMASAFSAGVEAVSFYGGAKVGSRTMLDALVPAADVLLSGTVSASAAAARKGADGTADMESASAGRSNYLSEEALKGTPDPGAIAVALVLESVAKEL